MTRIADGLRNALGAARAQLVHYGVAGMLVLSASVLMLSQPGAAAGICDIPGADGALSLFFGAMVSIIVVICIFKFGGSIVKAITGGPGSNAKLRISIIIVVVGLFVALGMDTILPWFMKQIGGSPKSVNVGCVIPGSGGGGNGGNKGKKGILLLAAGVPRPLFRSLQQRISNRETDE